MFRLALLLAILGVAGCAHYARPCDNPRNMQCMTADQLARELGTQL